MSAIGSKRQPSPCSLRVAPALASSPTATPQTLTLEYVQTADPAADLRMAIRAHQFQFVGLSEMGDFVPGAQNRPDLTSHFGFKYIHGTSDTTPKELQDAAWEYAQIYNELLVRTLRLPPQLGR